MERFDRGERGGEELKINSFFLKVSKDAKECMQECVSEFVSFLTSEYPLTVQVLLYIAIGTTVHPQLSNQDYPIQFNSQKLQFS